MKGRSKQMQQPELHKPESKRAPLFNILMLVISYSASGGTMERLFFTLPLQFL